MVMIFQLSLAVFLGLLICLEREYYRKSVGMRTYSLVCLGAALFTIISVYGFDSSSVGVVDPLRISSQIVVGIGFMVAGIIFLQGDKVQGLTTAAAVWVVAAIGMAVGARLFIIALFTTALSLIVVWGLRYVEAKVPRMAENEKE